MPAYKAVLAAPIVPAKQGLNPFYVGACVAVLVGFLVIGMTICNMGGDSDRHDTAIERIDSRLAETQIELGHLQGTIQAIDADKIKSNLQDTRERVAWLEGYVNSHPELATPRRKRHRH